MIKIHVPKTEYYNEIQNEFIEVKETTLSMEHSLISIRNWETKWNKAFLGRTDKSTEEILDYLRCMTVHPGEVDLSVYKAIPESGMKEISDYIKAPMTATVFYDEEGKGTNINKDTVTCELILYWMITLGIPMEFQKVHLNQLLTLIRLTSIKNAPPKKMSPQEILRRNERLNQQRRKKYNSKG